MNMFDIGPHQVCRCPGAMKCYLCKIWPCWCVWRLLWPRCILRSEFKGQELSWWCVILILLQRPHLVIQRCKVTCLTFWHF